MRITQLNRNIKKRLKEARAKSPSKQGMPRWLGAVWWGVVWSVVPAEEVFFGLTLSDLVEFFLHRF